MPFFLSGDSYPTLIALLGILDLNISLSVLVTCEEVFRIFRLPREAFFSDRICPLDSAQELVVLNPNKSVSSHKAIRGSGSYHESIEAHSTGFTDWWSNVTRLWLSICLIHAHISLHPTK